MRHGVLGAAARDFDETGGALREKSRLAGGRGRAIKQIADEDWTRDGDYDAMDANGALFGCRCGAVGERSPCFTLRWTGADAGA